MAAPVKVTEEMKVEINRLYDSKLSISQVSKIMQLNEKTIRKYIENIRAIGRMPGLVKSCEI